MVSPGSPTTRFTYSLDEPIASGSNAIQSKRLGLPKAYANLLISTVSSFFIVSSIEPPDIVVLVQANETMTYAARTTITMSITVLHILSRNVFS